MRVVRALGSRMKILAMTSSPDKIPALRAHGVVPLQGNLDKPQTLRRLAALAHRVLHLAPPVAEGWADKRTRALMRALQCRTPPHALVYGSTSGVYGNYSGAWVKESDALQAQTPRGMRRVDAESSVRLFGRTSGIPVSVLRIPGIYAPDRTGGTPRERLLKRTPVLSTEDDVYTNHIHADDLASACVRALFCGKSQRTYNVNDDTVLKMGDYFDAAADKYNLPRPPRVSRQVATEQLPVMLLSFMGESRRLVNQRMKHELRLKLRYPTVMDGL